MDEPRPRNYLIDMDGVLVSGSTMIPGADRFVEQLKSQGRKFLVLTNNPLYTPGDLSHRLKAVGLDVSAGSIFTAAIATSRFLHAHDPGDTAFVVGKPNPLMMRMALNCLDVDSEDTLVIGDRMKTDIVASAESGMETNLVLSGVTERDDVHRHPCQPAHIVESVADIEL